MKKRNWFIVLPLTLVVLLCSCGAFGDKTVSVGEEFEAEGLKGRAVSVDEDYTVPNDDYDLFKPESGYKFIMVDFSFENTGKSDEYVDVYDFKCYADDDTCEQHYYNDDWAKESQLSPGRSISFSTIFEVPEDASSIELEYEPNWLSDQKIIIKIK